MSRFTLRLPNSLHRELKENASQEGVSLNQYIVYALTRQVAIDVEYARSNDEMTEREVESAGWHENLRKGSDEHIETERTRRARVET